MFETLRNNNGIFNVEQYFGLMMLEGVQMKVVLGRGMTSPFNFTT